MNATWYCTNCERTIDRDEVTEHETDGHDVRGVLRPDRLLSNDPWQVGAGDGTNVPDGGEH